jgi:hypothetical protein
VSEVERLRADRDRFLAIVHAVSPYLDPAALGLTPEVARERIRDLLDSATGLRNLLRHAHCSNHGYRPESCSSCAQIKVEALR